MLLGKWSRTQLPIGIDLGSRMIRLCQLDHRGTGLAVTAAAACALPPEITPAHADYHKIVTDNILKLVGGGGFVGQNVVTCLPAEMIHYKNLRLPKMPPDELASAVSWEASERLSHKKQQVITQFYDAGEVRQGEDLREEVILMAASSPYIEAHVDALSQCGFRVNALDAIPGALARVLLHDQQDNLAEKSVTRVAVDIGWSSSKVLILHGRRIVFFKVLDIGGRRLDHAVAEHLGVSESEAREVRRRHEHQEPGEDAARAASDDRVERTLHDAIRPLTGELAREIGLCLRYYSVTFRGPRPDHATLFGGEAGYGPLVSMISEGAGIKFILGDPLKPFDCSAVQNVYRESPDRSSWAVAAGLALREVEREGKRLRAGGGVAA